MALNKAQLISDLTSYFNNVDSIATASSKAQGLADILETFVKSGSITVGSLSSTGTGNLGAPVTSTNTTGGSIS